MSGAGLAEVLRAALNRGALVLARRTPTGTMVLDAKLETDVLEELACTVADAAHLPPPDHEGWDDMPTKEYPAHVARGLPVLSGMLR